MSREVMALPGHAHTVLVSPLAFPSRAPHVCFNSELPTLRGANRGNQLLVLCSSSRCVFACLEVYPGISILNNTILVSGGEVCQLVDRVCFLNGC